MSEGTEPAYASTPVSDCSIWSMQQPVGVITLETKLLPIVASSMEPSRKRRRTIAHIDKVADPQTWVDLAR